MTSSRIVAVDPGRVGAFPTAADDRRALSTASARASDPVLCPRSQEPSSGSSRTTQRCSALVAATKRRRIVVDGAWCTSLHVHADLPGVADAPNMPSTTSSSCIGSTIIGFCRPARGRRRRFWRPAGDEQACPANGEHHVVECDQVGRCTGLTRRPDKHSEARRGRAASAENGESGVCGRLEDDPCGHRPDASEKAGGEREFHARYAADTSAVDWGEYNTGTGPPRGNGASARGALEVGEVTIGT